MNNYTYRNGRVRNDGVDVKFVRTRSGQKIRERNLKRVSDSRSLNKQKPDDRDNIKTFYRSRDELIKNDLKDVKIERSKRESSLDVKKIRRDGIENKNIERRTDTEQTKQLKSKENERSSNIERKKLKRITKEILKLLMSVINQLTTLY